MEAQKANVQMASPLHYTVPESEPTEDEVRKWQAELDRDRRANDRTPVAVVEGQYGFPLVICRDGSLHQLLTQPTGEGDVEHVWKSLPPVPGSPAALSGEYQPRNGRRAMYDCDEAAAPFLPGDE